MALYIFNSTYCVGPTPIYRPRSIAWVRPRSRRASRRFETEEERERIAPLVLAAVSDSTDFDIDAYHLKSQLAQENETATEPRRPTHSHRLKSICPVWNSANILTARQIHFSLFIIFKFIRDIAPGVYVGKPVIRAMSSYPGAEIYIPS